MLINKYFTSPNDLYSTMVVTAILALAKSSGYVNVCDVTPANDPERNLRPPLFLKCKNINFNKYLNNLKSTSRKMYHF